MKSNKHQKETAIAAFKRFYRCEVRTFRTILGIKAPKISENGTNRCP